MKMKNISIVLLSLVFANVAFAYGTEARRVGPSAAITFEPGKATLTKDSENKLKSLIKEARATGKIDEVQVAAWSDNPAPRKDENLSKVDRNLADQRAKVVKNYLKRWYKVSDVDTYNMAERSNWLARTFDTNEAEIKSEVANKNKDEMTKDEYKVFKESGQASRVVVQVLMKKTKQEAMKKY